MDKLLYGFVLTLILFTVLSCSKKSPHQQYPSSPQYSIQDSAFQATVAQYYDWVIENQFYFTSHNDSLRTVEEAHKWIGQVDLTEMEVKLSDQFSGYSPDLFLDTSNWQYVLVYGIQDTSTRLVSIGAFPQFDTADSTLLMGVDIQIALDSIVIIKPDPRLPGGPIKMQKRAGSGFSTQCQNMASRFMAPIYRAIYGICRSQMNIFKIPEYLENIYETGEVDCFNLNDCLYNLEFLFKATCDNCDPETIAHYCVQSYNECLAGNLNALLPIEFLQTVFQHVDASEELLEKITDCVGSRSVEDGLEKILNSPPTCDSTKIDSDGDGISDEIDNCPEYPNPNQLDSDGDGIGDACEAIDSTKIDSDGDGIPDGVDNCPDTPNPNQLDTDGDGIGDDCDDCDLPNPDGSMLPCTDPFENVDPADCDSAKLAEARAEWASVMACISGVPNPNSTELDSAELSAIEAEHRQFILNAVQPSQSDYCWWLSQNPTYRETVVISWDPMITDLVPRWRPPFHEECEREPEDYYHPSPDDDVITAFRRAERCWLSRHGLENTQSEIDYYRNILDCIPESIDWPDCMTPKLTCAELRAAYQSHIDNLRNQAAEDEDIIANNCN